MNKQKINYSNYRSKPSKINKRAKLHSIGHNLKNKIDDILDEAEAQKKLDHIYLNQQITQTQNPNNDLPIIIPKINPNNLPKINSNKIQNNIIPENEDRNKNYSNKNDLNLKNIEKSLKTVKKK